MLPLGTILVRQFLEAIELRGNFMVTNSAISRNVYQVTQETDIQRILGMVFQHKSRRQ